MTADETAGVGLSEAERREVDRALLSSRWDAPHEAVARIAAARYAAGEAAGRAAVVERVDAVVHAPETDRFRAEANQHTVEQPYADNRYVRLLDDLRALVADVRGQDTAGGGA